MVASRRATKSALARATISVSTTSIRLSIAANSAARGRNAAGARRKASIGLIGNHRDQIFDLVEATRRDDAELSQMAPQCIDEHRSLPDQEITDTVRDERRLLLRALDRHEAHGRPPHSLTDRFGISCIVLVALHVWFDVAWRHQAHLVPERGDLTGPKVRGAACFDAHEIRRQGSKKGCNLATAQPPAQNDSPGRINAVQLENMLRNVDTDGNLAHRWLP
jgi:hypothetical protein